MVNGDYIEQQLNEVGELMVVLDSGIEYELHKHDTDFTTNCQINDTVVGTEGMVDGEYKVVEFPVSSVEHVYVHKES